MVEVAPIHARRLPLNAWDNACRQVAGDPTPLNEQEWAELVATGVATAPGALDDNWAGLIATYLNTRSSVRCSATYNGLLYRSSLAVGTVSICVLERFTTAPAADGGVETVNRDNNLEIAVTEGHPWPLLQRVLPPLATVQAPMQQTGPAHAQPVQLPAPVMEWARDQARTHSPQQVLDTLKRQSAGRLRDFLNADDASISYVWTTATEAGLHLAFAWYFASEDHLFRATFLDDPAFEEVRPGDLAFTFEWHLLGVLDALGASTAKEA